MILGKYNKMSVCSFLIAIISVFFFIFDFKYNNHLFYTLSMSGYAVAWLLSLIYLIQLARKKTNAGEKGFFLSIIVMLFPIIMVFYAITHIKLG